MSCHPEYLRGMMSAVSIVSQFIDEERYVDPASVRDLRTLLDGLSMGVSMAELDMDQ